MSCWMRSDVTVSVMETSGGVGRELILGRTGLERESMQLVAHAALECLIDHLMLLHAALTLELRRDHVRRIVVAVAAQVFDGDLSIRQARLDEPLDGCRVDRQRVAP